MFMRKTTMLLAGAALVASAACDENRASNPNNSPPIPPAPQPSPELEQPSGGTPVTNTGATLEIDPLASAENRDRVKQYPDQVRIAPARTAQLITGFAAAVRVSPNGDETSTIETAQNVTEVARNRTGDYYLIVYSDPKSPSKELAGWVYKDALENTGWSTSDNTSGGSLPNTMASKLDCAHGEVHLRTDRDFCGKSCKDDGNCDKKGGEICDGLAFNVHERTNKTTSTRYCIPSGANANTTK
jgi:hypothetical protein